MQTAEKILIEYDYFPAGDKGQRKECWKAWLSTDKGLSLWGNNGQEAAKKLALYLGFKPEEYEAKLVD